MLNADSSVSVILLLSLFRNALLQVGTKRNGSFCKESVTVLLKRSQSQLLGLRYGCMSGGIKSRSKYILAWSESECSKELFHPCIMMDAELLNSVRSISELPCLERKVGSVPLFEM